MPIVLRLFRPALTNLLGLMLLFLVIVAVVLLGEVGGGRRGRAWLLVLPLLALAWVNLHGGFMILFPVLACYGAGIALTPQRRRALLGPFCLATAASAAAVLVNPWGFRVLRGPVGFFSGRGGGPRRTRGGGAPRPRGPA